MGRPRRFERAELLTLAEGVAADEGPDALTMHRLAVVSGASNGSVYHRFDSRAQLLGEVWLGAVERFQEDWWRAAEPATDPGEVAVLPVRWAVEHRSAAAVLALHRREDFLGAEALPAHRERARTLGALVRSRWDALSARFLGETTPEALERIGFAFATVPLAAIRHALADGSPIRPTAEGLVREAALALVPRRTP